MVLIILHNTESVSRPRRDCVVKLELDATEENTHLTAILKEEIYLAFNSLPLLARDSIIPLFTITELNVEHFVVKGTLFPLNSKLREG